MADAVAVLERVSTADTLWPVLRPSAVGKTYLSSEVVRQLNAFRDHLNARFGTAEAPTIPPRPDGEPCRITTRQFRRTIAWHIASWLQLLKDEPRAIFTAASKAQAAADWMHACQR